jgi:hypothetical protein
MTMSNHDLDWLATQQPRRMELDQGARERALQALAQHRARTGERGSSRSRPVRVRMFGFAVATGAAAIAAVLIVAGLVPSIAGSEGGVITAVRPSTGSPLVRTGQHASGQHAAIHHRGSVTSPLVRLAAYVSAVPSPPGDATLVARTTTNGASSVTVYDLYADNGQYFFSPTKSDLAGQVSADNNLADGLFAREIAAAKLAATGDVQTAAQDMADAPDPSHVVSPTQTASDLRARAAKAAATGVPQVGSLYDNYVWENSLDAIIAGSGDPQVRAGVLRILATLPGVTVSNGTSGGQPTLVLAAGGPELGGGYTEQLAINADSGVPLQLTTGGSATVDYQVSRVTLANPLANLPSGPAGSD